MARSKAKASALTPKQRLFALEYCANGCNATQAAISAGYSVKAAAQVAHETLRIPKVATFVSERLGKREKRLMLDAEKLDEELDAIAHAQLVDAYNEDGTVKAPHEFPERLKRAVTKIKSKEIFDQDGNLVGYLREVAIEGKVPAIKLGYQRRGELVEKHEVAVRSYADLVAEAAKRVGQRRAAGTGGGTA